MENAYYMQDEVQKYNLFLTPPSQDQAVNKPFDPDYA